MKRILIALVAFVLGTGGLAADNYGMTSFPVMMMESYGARILALADTGVALTGDLGALTANPAGIAGIERIGFSTMKLDWMFDTSFYNFAAVYPVGERGKSGVLGFTGVLFDNGGFAAIVDETATGGSAGSDFLFGFTYANNIFNFFNRKTAEKIHLNWGVAVKFARSVLAGYTASALAFDAGLNYSLRVPALGMREQGGHPLDRGGGQEPCARTRRFYRQRGDDRALVPQSWICVPVRQNGPAHGQSDNGPCQAARQRSALLFRAGVRVPQYDLPPLRLPFCGP